MGNGEGSEHNTVKVIRAAKPTTPAKQKNPQRCAVKIKIGNFKQSSQKKTQSDKSVKVSGNKEIADFNLRKSAAIFAKNCAMV
jgi:hypothetical protein